MQNISLCLVKPMSLKGYSKNFFGYEYILLTSYYIDYFCYRRLQRSQVVVKTQLGNVRHKFH